MEILANDRYALLGALGVLGVILLVLFGVFLVDKEREYLESLLSKLAERSREGC